MTDTFDFGDDNKLERDFESFHRANPAVYRIFKKFAFEAINKGRQHLGARMIWNRIRWYTSVETCAGDGFKLNNNHSPYYARMFMRDYPQHDGFFRTRRVQGEVA